MSEAVLKKFMYNGCLYDTSEFDEIYVDKNPSVYEVIRIIDNVPVFAEEHFERLLNSARLLGYNISIDIKAVKRSIKEMLISNNVSHYNIKIVINNLQNTDRNIYYFFTASNYPDEEMYKKGVDTLLFNAVRTNPNAKVIYKSLREEINNLLDETGNYEALLVNEMQSVTEGSRSNLFFIKNGSVYTASPGDVLLGITRQRIISLCRQNSIEVIEETIKVNDLNLFESSFISGTSPKVLPVRKIESIMYKTDSSLLKKIMEIYDNEIKRYIELNR